MGSLEKRVAEATGGAERGKEEPGEGIALLRCRRGSGGLSAPLVEVLGVGPVKEISVSIPVTQCRLLRGLKLPGEPARIST